MFISRYTPTTSLKTFFLKGYKPIEVPDEYLHEYFGSAREALHYYLARLKKMRPQKNKILVTAYICQAVTEVLQDLNFEIRYVDLEPNTIYHSQSDLATKVDKQTLAVIIAPYFGIYPKEKLQVKPYIKDALLVLDFAQCVGCHYNTSGADAIVMSYGLGKGIDLHGGSILYKKIDANDTLTVGKETWFGALTSAMSAIFKTLILKNKFLYKTFLRIIERQMELNKHSPSFLSYQKLSRLSEGFILKSLGHLQPLITISRKRAHLLYQVEGLKPLLLDPNTIEFENSTFLRFPLVPKNEEQSRKTLSFFQRHNIEISRANEKVHENGLPHFESLNKRVLKLPFLGSLKDDEFNYLLEVSKLFSPNAAPNATIDTPAKM